MKPKGMNPYTGESGPPERVTASSVQYGKPDHPPCDACVTKNVDIITYRSALKAIAEVDIIQTNEYTVERMDYIKTIAWIQALAKEVLEQMGGLE